jgi:hypothetical protein
MSITNNNLNLNLNLIMELLGHFVPDDIKHKIFIILLGIGKCGVKDAKQHKMLNCGNQYEIRPQENQLQFAIMCEIRIAQFDAAAPRKKSTGAIKNIKTYMNLLDAKFKQRYTFLF